MTSPRRHVMTVALEDYFQVGAFNEVIQQGQWYRFETRLQQNADRALKLLDRHGVKATFFVLGWIADRFPGLVRKVADQGHEIASKGYYHRGITQMTPDEFREDLRRSRDAIERASGQRVIGYRLANGWFRPQDMWALSVLAEEGYAYDSSVCPRGRAFADEPFRRFKHTHESNGKVITELPISTSSMLGVKLPIGGGNYVRQFPRLLMRRAIRRWDRKVDAPLVMYFHVWELDPEQPKISAASTLTHIRHYRNLHKMEARLEYFLKRYQFTSAADHLGIALTPPDPAVYDQPSEWLPDKGQTPVPEASAPAERTPISIVVPCYNEELVVPYMANTLSSVEARLRQYDITFVLVDDGSKDNTWTSLQATFGRRPGFELYRHEHNQGVAAAIMTGIRRAKNEIVCSIDCDCTYDPHELANMIPRLRPGVDLVTASPYHPEGHVRNVPNWRLRLSRTASWLYRRVLRHKLYTYTSCFRVYRRSAVADLQLRHSNFLGVAELLGRLDLQGSRIVEFPATLEVRMIGRSKMKTLRTILGHLKLMTRLYLARLSSRGKQPPADATPPVEPPQSSAPMDESPPPASPPATRRSAVAAS